MGGSDQWGNITAGVDLIRRLRGAKAHGLVMPLITTARAPSSARPEAGAVWLDPEPDVARSSSTSSGSTPTTATREGICATSRFSIGRQSSSSRRRRDAAPESREAQRALAREVHASRCHGAEHVTRAERASSVLFGEDISTLPADDVLAVFDDVPSSTVTRGQARRGRRGRWSSCLASSGLTASKGEATRLDSRRRRLCQQPADHG